MLGPVVRWKIGAAEKRLGVPMDYLRHLYAESPDAFWVFSKFVPIANYRKTLPPAPFHVARIAATKHEDCGPCVQICVNLAKEDGVPEDVLRAAVTGRADDLPESLSDVYRFGAAVAAGSGDEGPYRDRLRQVFGEAGVIELGLAVATGRVFPTLKRALGFAESCSRLPVTI